MQNFKQFLFEENDQFLPREEQMDWLEARGIKNYEFSVIGQVRTSENLVALFNLESEKYDGKLPVDFLKAESVKLMNLKSLIGCPEICRKLEISKCLHVSSLKGISQVIEEDLNFEHDGTLPDGLDAFPRIINRSGKTKLGCMLFAQRLETLSGIHKHCNSIQGTVGIGGTSLKSAFLGLLKIKDVGIYTGINTKNGPKHGPVFDIINKFYEKDGSGDVMDCHEALTRAGLKEYAKL